MAYMGKRIMYAIFVYVVVRTIILICTGKGINETYVEIGMVAGTILIIVNMFSDNKKKNKKKKR